MTATMTILEIAKYTIPALTVFVTVYFLQKQYLENQYKMQMLEVRKGQKDTTLPLKLQAFERLTLFCERIELQNLILRIRTESMTASNLHIGILVSIQKEYEHNVAMQVYTSPELWEIIKFVKNESFNVVNKVSKEVAEDADALEFSQALFKYANEIKFRGVEQALLAIKKEAGLLM